MKRLFALIRQDALMSARDSIVLYIMIAPLLLAVVARVLVPSVQNNEALIAVTANLPDSSVESLQAFGRVQRFEDLEDLERRVGQADDVPGFTLSSGDRLQLVLEGNETEESRAAFELYARAASGTSSGVPVTLEPLSEERSRLYEYVAIFLALMAIMLAGMMMGFSLVEDRSSGVTRAMAVTPTTLQGFLTAKTVFVAFFALTGGIVTYAVLLGGQANYGLLLLALLAAAPVGAVLGIITGLVADSQIAAIGAAKIMIPVFGIPAMLALLIPHSWHWTLFVFPNYWAFVTLQAGLLPGTTVLGFWPSAALSLGLGVALIALVSPMVRRRFGLR